MFGRGYEEIGSSDKGLILKNSGKIKIQWGKKFIDLLDSNGNLNVKVQSLIKEISSESDIKLDGFYYFDGSLIAKIGDDIIELTSESGTTYVSFILEQETTNSLKYTALQNIGFIYSTQSDSNVYPTNGIIYIEDSLSLFIVNNGTLSSYIAPIPNPFTEKFIIQKTGDSSEGALVIQGEGLSNGLLFDSLKIYSKGLHAAFETDKEYLFYIANNKTAVISLTGIEVDLIKSFGANDNRGYRIWENNGKYQLDIDKINVREPMLTEAEKYIIPSRIYNKENIILETNKEYNRETFLRYAFVLKYPNQYKVGDIIKTYVDLENEDTALPNIIPVLFTITTIENNTIYSTLITSLVNNVTVDNIYNSICYLFSTNSVKNLDLIIGELDSTDRYNTKENGIISKLNIFYSTKFDKEGSGTKIFPFYTEKLEEELANYYNDDSYKYVIPPISLIKTIATEKAAGILKTMLAELNEANPVPDLEGYLHYEDGVYDWQMPSGGGSGGGDLDVFDTLLLLYKDKELTISPSSSITLRANDTNVGNPATVSVTCDTVWDVTARYLTITGSHGVGNGSFGYEFGVNDSFYDKQTTIYVVDMFYDRLEELYPSDTATLNKHIKTIIFRLYAKKTLSVSGTISTQAWDTTSLTITLSSSFDISSYTNGNFCTVGTTTLDKNLETVSVSITMTLNTSTTSDRTDSLTFRTTDGLSLTVLITQSKKSS